MNMISKIDLLNIEAEMDALEKELEVLDSSNPFENSRISIIDSIIDNYIDLLECKSRALCIKSSKLHLVG